MGTSAFSVDGNPKESSPFINSTDTEKGEAWKTGKEDGGIRRGSIRGNGKEKKVDLRRK